VTWNYGKNRPIEQYFCDNTCKGIWQIAQRESLGFTKEWLIQEYVEKGRSADDIALSIGRDPKRVWQWLKDYGIQTRQRGADYGQLFQKGCESAFKGKSHTLENRKRTRELRLKDGRVPYLKNGRHWLHEEGAVSPNWKGGVTPDRQDFYSTKEWKSAVAHVFARDKSTCRRCGSASKLRGDMHVHHVVSFAVRELRSDVSNLVLLCVDCHRWVHSNKNEKKEYTAEVAA
jgi:hypothetical protein